MYMDGCTYGVASSSLETVINDMKEAVPGPRLGLSDQLTSRQPYFDFLAPSPCQYGCHFNSYFTHN